MAIDCDVKIDNVADNQTIQTSSSPPFFQVAVKWKNSKQVDGVVSLAGGPGVTITPLSYVATKQTTSYTISYFSLSAAVSVSGVVLTAGLVVPCVPPFSKSVSVTDVTVTVT